MGAFEQAIGTAVGLGTRLLTKPSFPSLRSPKIDLYQEIDRALGQFRKVESQGSRDAQSRLAGVAASLAGGELPPEIEALVRRSAAEFGTAAGLGASQTGARTARDLGLTALDLTMKGTELTQALQALELNRYNTARGSALDVANIKFKKSAIAMNHAYAKFAVSESRSQEFSATAAALATQLASATTGMMTGGGGIGDSGVLASQTDALAPGLGGVK